MKSMEFKQGPSEQTSPYGGKNSLLYLGEPDEGINIYISDISNVHYFVGVRRGSVRATVDGPFDDLEKAKESALFHWKRFVPRIIRD